MGNMLLRDISIYWCLIHVLVIFMMLFQSRYGKKKTMIMTSVVIAVLMVLNGVGLAVLGHETMGKLFLFTCSLPSFVYFWLLSSDRKGRFLFTFCLADTICLWLMVATNLLDTYLGGGKYILMLVSRLVLYPLLEYLVYRYLQKGYLELQASVEDGWNIFAGLTVLYYVLLAVFADFPTNISYRPEDTFVCILILALMFFTYATIFYALHRQLLLHRKQENERVLLEQKHSLEIQLENQQQIRKMKHDMKGHRATLSGLLSAGMIEEATAYLREVELRTEPLLQQFCANTYLNAVLSHYYNKFKELETELRMDIQVGEEVHHYMELCQILSNGLENAWESVKDLPVLQRDVSVQMKYNKNYLIIRIKNRCRSDLFVEKGTIPKSSKKEREHGFGLSTVQEAAVRLNGEMFAYTDSGNFVLDVMVQTKDIVKTEAA